MVDAHCSVRGQEDCRPYTFLVDWVGVRVAAVFMFASYTECMHVSHFVEYVVIYSPKI